MIVMSALEPLEEGAVEALLSTFLHKESLYKRRRQAQKQREAQFAKHIAQKSNQEQADDTSTQLLKQQTAHQNQSQQIQYPPHPQIAKKGLQAVTL